MEIEKEIPFRKLFLFYLCYETIQGVKLGRKRTGATLDGTTMAFLRKVHLGLVSQRTKRGHLLVRQ
jgi:hypothetical protein